MVGGCLVLLSTVRILPGVRFSEVKNEMENGAQLVLVYDLRVSSSSSD